jgi:hypothetical protein
MWKRLHVDLSDVNETSNLSADFLKKLTCKFNQSPSSGSRSVPYGRTDGRT